MGTNFPTSLDTHPSAATLSSHTLATDPHSTLHGDLGLAVDALEAKVGADSSAVTTSHDYLIGKRTVALTAKGMLLSASAANTPGGLTVGADDTMLMADSGQTTGLKWATPTVVKTALSLDNVSNTSDATKNSATATLTNKRVTPRVGTTTSSATPTINTDNVDQYTLTAQAAAITSMSLNLSGTPTDGQTLMIRITGDSTPRAITWGASFASSGVATLLATTAASKTHHVGLRYDSTLTKWVCLAVDATGY